MWGIFEISKRRVKWELGIQSTFNKMVCIIHHIISMLYIHKSVRNCLYTVSWVSTCDTGLCP